jgi:2-polyprenyl-6-methoxyphenol hydroxylase-like FAD-dependent oxidoreductase
VRALVVGAGPAGLLSAVVLSQRGVRAHIVDPEPGNGSRTRPQSVHVHLWQHSAWQRLTAWLPILAEWHGPFPERATLDELLWTLCRPQVVEVHTARVRQISFRSNCVQVLLGSGRRDFDLIIDASGASRATVYSVAQTCGQPVILDEGPPSDEYVTFRLSGVDSGSEGIVLAVRDAGWGGGAILRQEPQSMARLTLQVPAGADRPKDLPSALAFLAALNDSKLYEACNRAKLSGSPARYVGQPNARLALEAMSGLPDRWIPIGDCLLATPPCLGQGIDQLTEQVELMASGLDTGISWAESRARLVARARERWWGATWIEALRAPML